MCQVSITAPKVRKIRFRLGQEFIPRADSAILASVADDQVVAFRENRRTQLEPDLAIECSHLLTEWPKDRLIRDLLIEAIDAGEPLRSDLKHSRRVPVWHSAGSAANISRRLLRAGSAGDLARCSTIQDKPFRCHRC